MADLGVGQFYIASIVLGLRRLLLLPTMKPRKLTSDWSSSHLDGLVYNLCCFRRERTVLRCWTCSLSVCEYIMMSSIYAMTNLNKCGLKICYMSLVNDAGALVRPKGMTLNS